MLNMSSVTLVTREKFIDTYGNKKLGEFYAKKYSYLFPFNATPTLSAITGDITGDGHFGKGIIQFISKKRKRVLMFAEDFYRIFKYKTQIRKSPSNPNVWECIIGGNTICRFFKLIEVPFGNKTNNSFLIPYWILNGSDEIKKKYLQRLFDCEGSITFQKNKRALIKFCMFKEMGKKENLQNFLNQLRGLLQSFDINTTNVFQNTRTNLRKDGSKSICLGFEIQGNSKNYMNILNFYKKINFESTIKSEKLKKYLGYIIKASDDQCPCSDTGKAQLG